MLDDTVPNQVPNIPDIPAPEPVVKPEVPPVPPPPAGDEAKAEKYLNQLIELINQDKLSVIHTDLQKFNIADIEDHYHMDLSEYEVEINHSKQPDTGQDFYIMLFNNIKKIDAVGQSCTSKVILAYTHLTQPQFEDFKEAADIALDRLRKKEDAKRFAEAMSPIDNLLDNLNSSSSVAEEDIKEEPEDLADFNEPSDNSPKASDFLSQPPQPQPTI